MPNLEGYPDPPGGWTSEGYPRDGGPPDSEGRPTAPYGNTIDGNRRPAPYNGDGGSSNYSSGSHEGRGFWRWLADLFS